MRGIFQTTNAVARRGMGWSQLWSVRRRGLQSKGKFSCISLSQSGEQNQQIFSFHDLHRMGLHARDLFALNLVDESITRDFDKPQKRLENRVPFIFVPREKSIIVSLGNIKSIVYKDNILIFNPRKPVVRAWTSNLAEMLPNYKKDNPETPFEVFVMEKILQELTEMFDRRLRIYNPLVNNLLSNVGCEEDTVEGIQKLVPLQVLFICCLFLTAVLMMDT